MVNSKLPPYTFDDGPDVELDEIGMTEADVDAAVASVRLQVAEQVETERRSVGRPSLTGKASHSPHLTFRVDPDSRQRLQDLADAEGVPASKVARRALDEYLSRHQQSA
ncbi:hypothetical protein D1871_04900 [Nakamurella silvestris]|nr:hypothetical protein D1871_04900 [Nakamurella silvestris]